MIRSTACWPLAAALVAATAVPRVASAAPFEMAISPSRFELSGKGGTRIGQTLDLQNVGNQPTEVAVRTIDWSFSEDGAVSYHDALQPDSCRPWVTLERPPAAPRASRETRVPLPDRCPVGCTAA